jgi:PAS domain S-box-containing protein
VDTPRSNGSTLFFVERTAQKSLPLILAREFASNVATPITVMDEVGTLVFFNEPAERIIGQTYAEVGELPADQWERLFQVERLDGSPIRFQDMPAGIAHREKRPAHGTLAFTTVDGRRHEIAVTAFPMLGRDEELLGVVAVFWQQRNE